jgi:hypothetical protein
VLWHKIECASQGSGEKLAARVCGQKESGVNLDPRISRNLHRFGGLVEGKVN